MYLLFLVTKLVYKKNLSINHNCITTGQINCENQNGQIKRFCFCFCNLTYEFSKHNLTFNCNLNFYLKSQENM